MFMLQRRRSVFICATMGLIILTIIFGSLALYRAQIRQTHQHFDSLLRQRADDVSSVVLDDNENIDANALQYTGDLNSLGMDVYLFYADGSPLHVPAKRRVDGLPALAALKDAVRGDEDVRTLSLGGTTTRVLTHPVISTNGEFDQIVIIVQVGRSEAPLAAARRRLATLVSVIGAGIVLSVVIGGLLLVHQLSIPVRRSLAQQQAFVANAAHELRTPLSVIQATAEFALMRVRRVEEYMTYLDRIGRTVMQTSAMVDDLLTLAQLDASPELLPFAPINLREIVTTVVTKTTLLYPDNLLTMAAVGEPIIQGDVTLLERLVNNLVDNACRYNPIGTSVHLTLETRRKWVILQVIDAGQGIAASEIPHLFERFYRGQSGRQSGQRGSGIGLSLVRQIAIIHGGNVGLTSRVGIGTTVTVVMPRALNNTVRNAPHREAEITSRDLRVFSNQQSEVDAAKELRRIT